jgi:hypothetical protein
VISAPGAAWPLVDTMRPEMALKEFKTIMPEESMDTFLNNTVESDLVFLN